MTLKLKLLAPLRVFAGARGETSFATIAFQALNLNLHPTTAGQAKLLDDVYCIKVFLAMEQSCLVAMRHSAVTAFEMNLLESVVCNASFAGQRGTCIYRAIDPPGHAFLHSDPKLCKCT